MSTDELVMEAAQQQVEWWQRQGWTPYEAWEALGGSGVNFGITWAGVRALTAHHAREFNAFRHKRAA